jgi:hypothetical protein
MTEDRPNVPSAAPVAAAPLPAALATPGATVIVAYRAVGAQIYECKSGSDGKPAWTFREPIASLFLDGKTVGRHYAGPTWENVDGSAVVGKAVANVPGTTPDDIPWLKLQVVAHSGNGVLADVDTVLRINTRGGALKGGCEQAGGLCGVPYSCDYVFLHTT